MKRKLLMLALCAALALCALPMAVSAEGNVAKIGDKEYATLQAAVDAVPADNTQTTITLLGNASGDGVQVKDGQNIIFDLASYTYNIDGTTVGSPSTETNGFQLLKGSTVAFQNGTITSNKAKILIQNYCNLTLTDVNLDGKGLVNGANSYVLSNNNGSVQLIGNTSITAPDGGVAFDMYYWPSNGYTDGVKVTVNTTGSINGKIEYGCDSTGVDNVAEKAILNIQNGTFNGSLSTSLTDTGITVVGGSFSDTSFIDYCEDGKTLVKDPDTNMFVPQSKPVVATVNGKDYYSLAEAATAAAGTSDKTLTLKADATLDSMLTINTEGMVIDLNGFTITASGNFPKDADKNNNHLVDITADNVTLKNGTLKAGSSNNHTLNVWNAQGVQLAGLTLDNAATYEGAPLIVGASDVTVNGPLKVVTGANSWYGINVDSRNVGGAGKGASITVAPNVALEFEGQNPTGIYMENSAGMHGEDVKLSFGPGVTFNSAIANFVPVVVKTGHSAAVKDRANAALQDNGDGTFGFKPAPESPDEPSGSGGSAPAATPTPALVLDSTPKTGAVSLSLLPLAGLGLAALGAVSRKRR